MVQVRKAIGIFFLNYPRTQADSRRLSILRITGRVYREHKKATRRML